MPDRLALHALLLEILDSENVYFQPPESVKMSYPCIRYERDYVQLSYADNAPYRAEKRYRLTVISKDPDSTIPDQLLQLPKCAFDRHYTAENLHHSVLILYF